jgi:ATP adenylyltransferase
MERLWTPWRFSYVTASSSALGESACVLCDAERRGLDEPLFVFGGPTVFVVLNKFPYNNGHLMVVPRRHVPRLSDLTTAELTEVMMLAQAAERALGSEYGPHGFNMGINLGKSAGAGIAEHLHLHVVPRWDGDTSFMSVLGETRVLPEELAATASRMRAAFTALVDGLGRPVR